MNKLLFLLDGWLISPSVFANSREDVESSRVSFIATRNSHPTDIGRRFGLAKAIGGLRKRDGLKAVSLAVPVSAVLIFTQC